MKIRIVCYEDVHRWIIGKFALKLKENLDLLGHDVSIDYNIDETADVNHHIIYSGYSKEVTKGIQTLMITHIDSSQKIDILKDQISVADMGICMSRDSTWFLHNLGIPRNKLSYVNPAHDGVIKLKRNIVGITCRVQEDGRKREYFLSRLTKYIDCENFSFIIMGDGWDKEIEIMHSRGFEIEYYNQFDYNTYTKIIPRLDYYLYMGQDEGQMGFIDAVAAGIPTIVTLQGYHLDAKNGISYGFNTFTELKNIFIDISLKREKYINSVASWTWINYTLKHLDIWNYLLAKKQKQHFLYKRETYSDGINSVEEFDTDEIKLSKIKSLKDSAKLYKGYIKHWCFFKFNRLRKKMGS